MQRSKPAILFENDDFVVLVKPSGILSIPDRKQSEVSLKDQLIEKYGEIFTVHRLDKGTSGLILFAKNTIAHKELSTLFQSRQVEKYYEGLVIGNPDPEQGTVDKPIMAHPSNDGRMVINDRGKEAVTYFDTIERYRHFSRMRFQIVTGRTHQIRLHMAAIGHPIVCDELYGNGEPIFLSKYKRHFKLSKSADEERPLLNRLALHSFSIRFKYRDDDFYFDSPVPKDLEAVYRQFDKLS